MREAYRRPGDPVPGRERQQESGFWRYDRMVCDTLNVLKASFPPTYHVQRAVGRGWYLAPPHYSARVAPLEVRLCFGERGQPVSFELHTASPDDRPLTCALEEGALRLAIASLFPRFAAI